MKNKHHKIYDIILKIIISSYLNEFLAYIRINKTIVKVLNTEIITLNGKTVYLDFLAKTDDNKLYNIEFQLNGPSDNDLERFFDYNIIANVRYDKKTETIIVNFRTLKSGKKQIKITDTIDFHPKLIHLAEIDYEKILNNIENKVKNNSKLTRFEEISLMLMTLLPKYKDKINILKRICNVLRNIHCFNKKKLDTIKGIIQLEIEHFIPKNKLKEFKKEIKMTPETLAIFEKAIEETNRKYAHIEREEARKKGKKEGRKEGRKEGKKEGKKEIVKNMLKVLSIEEVATYTGLRKKEILDL